MYMRNSGLYKLPASPQTLPSSLEQGLLWVEQVQLFLHVSYVDNWLEFAGKSGAPEVL